MVIKECSCVPVCSEAPSGSYECLCQCDVWSSAPPWMCAPHIRVLYTQHDVVVGAGAGVLSQQASGLQQRRLARHRRVARSPGFTVVGGQTDTDSTGAVPDQLLRPGEGQGQSAKVFLTFHNASWDILSALNRLLRCSVKGETPLINSVLPGPPDREDKVTLDSA